MKRTKITINKKRFSKTIISFLSIMFLAGFLCNLALGDTVSKEKDYMVVVVAPGDTLWKIASTHSPKGDLRKKIDDIIKFNNLSGSNIQINQRIKIPIE